MPVLCRTGSVRKNPGLITLAAQEILLMNFCEPENFLHVEQAGPLIR
jgi:hypothetical protein